VPFFHNYATLPSRRSGLPAYRSGYGASQGVDKVYRLTLPADPEQASMTALGYIHGLIRDGREDPVVRAATIRLLMKHQVPQKDHGAAVQLIHEWVKQSLYYVNDPNGVETLIRARNLLEMIEHGEAAADCDDHVILEQAMLQSIGIPTRTVIIKGDRGAPHQWSHIYLEALVRGRWIGLDPIMKDKPAGWAPPRYFDKRVIPVGEGAPFPPRNGKMPSGMSLEHYAGWGGFGRYGAISTPPVCKAPDTGENVGQAGYEGWAYAYAIRIVAEAGLRPQDMEPAAWVGHISTIERGQVGKWQLDAAARQAGGVELFWGRFILRSVGTWLNTHNQQAVGAKAFAGVKFLEDCAAGRAESAQAAAPLMLKGQLQQEIAELIRMRTEALSYVEPLLNQAVPLIEFAERKGKRIEAKIKLLKDVNRVVQAVGVALSALGSVTAGITEVINIALQVGNAAWQIRQAGRAIGGSAAKTLEAISGTLDQIQGDLDDVTMISRQCDGEIVTIKKILMECFPEAPFEPVAAELPGRQMGPLALLLGVLAVAGVGLVAA
jgi:hypothetical protein